MAECRAFLVPTLVTYEVMLEKGPALGLSQFSLEKLRTVAEAGLRNEQAQPLLEQGAVGQTGERIVMRHVTDALS